MAGGSDPARGWADATASMNVGGTRRRAGVALSRERRPEGGTAAIMSNCHKIRFVVSVFHSELRLKSAIEDLRRIGVAASDIVLLGCPGALNGHLDDAAGKFLAGSVELVDGAGPDGHDQTAHSLKQQAADFENWIAAPFAQGLKNHITRGGCLLFVATPLSDVEYKVSEMLLRVSADSVQSHEFSIDEHTERVSPTRRIRETPQSRRERR